MAHANKTQKRECSHHTGSDGGRGHQTNRLKKPLQRSLVVVALLLAVYTLETMWWPTSAASAVLSSVFTFAEARITDSIRYKEVDFEEMMRKEKQMNRRKAIHTHKAHPEDFRSTVSDFPVFGFLPAHRLPPKGFPYHYYFENGVTHLIFFGLVVDDATMTIRGHRVEDEQLPSPEEWVQLRALAKQYKVKLLLSIGGPGERSKGLSSVLHLYFYNVDHEKERRVKRNEMIKEIAKFYVDWDLDGVDVDWKVDPVDRGKETTHYWLGIRNFLRDIKEEVMLLRGQRTGKPHSSLPHFFTSLTMEPTINNMAVVQMGNMSAYIDVIHWMLYDDPPESSFLQHTREESTQEREKHELGHGPQHGSYYHHSSLNFTLYHALRIAESRLAAKRGEDMALWAKKQRIRVEDEIILEGLPVYHLDLDYFHKIRKEVAEELSPYPTTFPVSKKQQALDDKKTFYYEQKGDCMHTLGIPFYGMDLRRGPQMYSNIVAEVRGQLKEENRGGWEPYDPNDIKGLQSNPHWKDWEKVYILHGMGFDNVEVVRQKMRIASQLGFGGMMIWELGQDVLPTSYTSIAIPPLPVPEETEEERRIRNFNPLTDDERLFRESLVPKGPGGLDLSHGIPAWFDGKDLPPAPKAPSRALLRAIHDEVELWSSETELQKPKEERVRYSDPDTDYLHPVAEYIPRLHKSPKKPPRQEPPRVHEVDPVYEYDEFGDIIHSDPELKSFYFDDL